MTRIAGQTGIQGGRDAPRMTTDTGVSDQKNRTQSVHGGGDIAPLTGETDDPVRPGLAPIQPLRLCAAAWVCGCGGAFTRDIARRGKLNMPAISDI